MLYAERSVKLGKGDRIQGGNVGVAALAVQSFGPQLVVGDSSFVDPEQDLIAPSVQLDKEAFVGDVETSSLTNHGGQLRLKAPLPKRMPSVPIALSSALGSSNVTVDRWQSRNLTPGAYATLTVNGTLVLEPGTFFFSALNIGDGARVLALPGGADVHIAATLATGEGARLSPLEPEDGWDDSWGTETHCQHQPPSALRISISGYDAGSPVARVGSRSSVSALLSAPHGTLSIADDASALGSFAGFDVALADRVTLSYESGFSTSSSGQAGTQQLTGYVGGAASAAPVTGPVPPETPFSVTIGLPPDDPQGLTDMARQIANPFSPLYRDYLTPTAIADAFGPSSVNYQSLQSWAQANSLTVVQTTGSRMLLSISSTVANIQRALFANLDYGVRPDGTQFVTVDRNPSLDFAPTILWIDGLSTYSVDKPLQQGLGPGGTLDGQDFRAQYLACTTLLGENQAIALVEPAGDYSETNITQYLSKAGTTTNATIARYIPPGQTQSPLGGAGERECEVDIETVLGILPNISTIEVYEGNGDSGQTDIQILAFLEDFAPPVISISWIIPSNTASGGPDPNMQFALNVLAMEGSSVFAGSGDSGALFAPLPTDIRGMDSITIVGGTTMSPLGGELYSEVAWPQSGGGAYSPFPIPYYQATVNMALSGGSTAYRNFPDVSAVACSGGGANGLFFFDRGSTDTSGCGTSVATPVWASFITLVNEQSQQLGYPNVGFANPMLYFASQTSQYRQLFHDVASGSNGEPGYDAVNGYDLVTGLGTPACNLLLTLAPPVLAPTLSVAMSETLTGPAVCMFGTGFTPGASVQISYSGIPGQPQAVLGSSAIVQHTGLFALTDTTEEEYGIYGQNCSPAQLNATVTVAATAGSLVASAQVPAYFFCPNGNADFFNGGCGGCGPAGCGACPGTEQICGGTCCPQDETCQQALPTALCCSSERPLAAMLAVHLDSAYRAHAAWAQLSMATSAADKVRPCARTTTTPVSQVAVTVFATRLAVAVQASRARPRAVRLAAMPASTAPTGSALAAQPGM